MVFDFISSNIDEVLLINVSANVFVFGDFNVHHKDRLIYPGVADRPGEPVIISQTLSQTTLLRELTFLLGSLILTLTVLLFWIYLFLLMLIFVLYGFLSNG